MSAALMQGHCLQRRPCTNQHMSGGREFHRKYQRQLHHISPDTRRYMRQGWINVEPTSQTVGSTVSWHFVEKLMNIQSLNHPPYPNRWMITLIRQGSGGGGGSEGS